MAEGSLQEVVAGVDGSPGATDALGWALEEADRRGVRLRAVAAWQPPDGLLDRLVGERAARAESAERKLLAEAVAEAVRRTGCTAVPVEQVVVRAHPVQALVEASGPSALLVTGRRGRGQLRGLLLGSVSQSLAQHARGSLVVVPPPEETAPPEKAASPAQGRVVVGVDGSPACLGALRFAAEAARLRGARLDVVHAWVDTVSGYGGPLWALPRKTLESEARAVLDDAVRSLGRDPGVEVRAELVEGLEYGVLLDAARGADLVAVGSRGRGGWSGLLLGSVGVHVVTAAPCPVAVVRSGADA